MAMNVMVKQKYWLHELLLLSLLLILFGCSGGGGGEQQLGENSSTSSANTGRVVVLLTDKPTEEFDEINVSILSVELLSEDGKVTIYNHSQGRVINLLDLRGEFHLFRIATDVPAGWYEKIRLTVNSVELVKYSTIRNEEDSRYYPKLPGNGKIDLNPGTPFYVGRDKTLELRIDMDADKSIHIINPGGKEKYNFRPVIFVDIKSDEPSDSTIPDKLIRVHGNIHEMYTSSFLLCPSRDTSIASEVTIHQEGCIEVHVNDETSIFNDLGDPVRFIELRVGLEVEAIGKLLKDRPDIDDGDRSMEPLQLHAYVVEIGERGTFLSLNGTISSEPQRSPSATAVFDFQIAPNQGFSGNLDVQVQLIDASRIFTSTGEELAIADLLNEVGSIATIDAILVLSGSEAEPNVLKAALVVVDTSVQISEIQGIISTINLPDGTLFITCKPDQFECNEGEEICAIVSENTHMYALSINNKKDSIEMSPLKFSQLELFDEVGLFVQDNGRECFDAQDVFVTD
jgi:hypothetical protein